MTGLEVNEAALTTTSQSAQGVQNHPASHVSEKEVSRGHVFLWLTGSFLLLAGLGGVFTGKQSEILPGIFTALTGALLIPPLFAWFERLIKYKLAPWVRVLLILALLIMSRVTTNSNTVPVETQRSAAASEQAQPPSKHSNAKRESSILYKMFKEK
jgi:hypothetical protein